MALNRHDHGLFDEETERILEAYADHAALLVHQYQTALK